VFVVPVEVEKVTDFGEAEPGSIDEFAGRSGS
jgi:hypothetical protein